MQWRRALERGWCPDNGHSWCQGPEVKMGLVVGRSNGGGGTQMLEGRR